MKKQSFISKQNYIKELTIPEHIILWLNVALSLSFFIVQLAWLHNYSNWTTWVTFIATIISIFAVMAGAKKRVICPLLGIIASILLIAISWANNLYGSMIMYGYNIIMQTISFITWIRSSDNKVWIEPKQAKWWACIIYLVCLIGLTILWTWVEGLNGFNAFWSGNAKAKPLPLVIRVFDSINLIFTIGTIVPMVKRYNQVWIMYIITNVAIAIVWMLKGIYANTADVQFNAWSMMCSGLCMTATSILGLISWKKASKKKQK